MIASKMTSSSDHPTFDYYLDAHRYLRVHGLLGAWRPERVALRIWRLVECS
jgi:hypothetical protein